MGSPTPPAAISTTPLPTLLAAMLSALSPPTVLLPLPPTRSPATTTPTITLLSLSEWSDPSTLPRTMESSMFKREADPYVAINPYTGLSYTGLPLAYAGVPTTYGVPVVKNVMGSHAVALTPFGATHSSNVGVCTNNNGERVAC